MVYAELFWVFFLVGLFCFGGGYAAIPFVQNAVLTHEWMTINEFMDMIAVAESTPGPVAVNTATYVGFKLGGFFGAGLATFALCLPAFLIVATVSFFLKTERGQYYLKRLMKGIRPVVVGLIFFAAWTIAKNVLIVPVENGAFSINGIGCLIAAIAFLAIDRLKVNPIVLIALSAVVGILLL